MICEMYIDDCSVFGDHNLFQDYDLYLDDSENITSIK